MFTSKANADEEKEVLLRRAQEYPKPQCLFSPERFDYWLTEYLSGKGLAAPEEMDADDFSRWVFPRLFENRLPKYQYIAEKYGTTIPSSAFQNITTEQEFLDIVVAHLPDHYS